MEPDNPNFLPTSRPEITEPLDCWNKIGVLGNGSCVELQKFVHCRNCPVYSIGAINLLNRPLPADYRRDSTQYFSRARADAAVAKISVVVFRIATEWLALTTGVFQEIVEHRVIHSLPHRENGIVLGLINLRGELQICVSLEKLLGIQPGASANPSKPVQNRLMVTLWQGGILAFPVDEIHGTHRYHPDELKSVPATIANTRTAFTRGILDWKDHPIGCLDEDILFSTLNRSLA